jgi:hypothetical protein
VADLLTGGELGELFRTFRRSAFRLETRDRYNAPAEQAAIRRFLAGDPDEEYLQAHPWYDLTWAAAAERRPFSRVRVVTVPLGEYSHYALWSARGNLRAGEDIRYLDRDRAAGLGLPVRPPLDAWLFDDERVAILRFDDDDVFIGAELLDNPATVEQHIRWRDIARNASVSRDEFIRSL